MSVVDLSEDRPATAFQNQAALKLVPSVLNCPASEFRGVLDCQRGVAGFTAAMLDDFPGSRNPTTLADRSADRSIEAI